MDGSRSSIFLNCRATNFSSPLSPSRYQASWSRVAVGTKATAGGALGATVGVGVGIVRGSGVGVGVGVGGGIGVGVGGSIGVGTVRGSSVGVGVGVGGGGGTGVGSRVGTGAVVGGCTADAAAVVGVGPDVGAAANDVGTGLDEGVASDVPARLVSDVAVPVDVGVKERPVPVPESTVEGGLADCTGPTEGLSVPEGVGAVDGTGAKSSCVYVGAEVPVPAGEAV